MEPSYHYRGHRLCGGGNSQAGETAGVRKLGDCLDGLIDGLMPSEDTYMYIE